MSFHKKEFIYNVAGLRFFEILYVEASRSSKISSMCKYYLYCTVFEVIFLIFSFKNGFQESHESLGEQNHWFLDKWLFGQTLPRNKALVRQSWFPLRRLTTQLYIKPWREGAIRGSEIFQAPGHWKKKHSQKNDRKTLNSTLLGKLGIVWQDFCTTWSP